MGVGNLGIGVSVGGGLGRLPFCSFIQPSVSPLLPGFPGFPYSSTFHLLDTGSPVHFDSLGTYCTFIQYSLGRQVSMALESRPGPVHFVLMNVTGKVD